MLLPALPLYAGYSDLSFKNELHFTLLALKFSSLLERNYVEDFVYVLFTHNSQKIRRLV